MGEPSECIERLHEYAELGISEIACLMNFGNPDLECRRAVDGALRRADCALRSLTSPAFPPLSSCRPEVVGGSGPSSGTPSCSCITWRLAPSRAGFPGARRPHYGRRVTASSPRHQGDPASPQSAGTEVLVAGAGPTGLLLAAELRRRGVACLLIDAEPQPLHWDRATVVHPLSLEMFESLELIGEFLAAGVRQRAVRIHSDGRVLGEMDLTTSGSADGFNLGVSEEVTESILTGHLRRMGGDVARSCRLVSLEPRSDGILAVLESDGGHEEVVAQWVVGCDGLHSAARDLAGIAFESAGIAHAWAVLDATLDGWADDSDVTFAYLDTPTVILTALPHRRWRIYLRPGSPASDLVAEATATIRAYQPAAFVVDVENPTRFHCHTKVARRFRSGRVLVAGDAAHVSSPAEGHGMNGGLQDALNLAWKLSLVCRGVARPALLDSYEAERRPLAVMVARSGEAFERAQTPPGSAERADRDRAIAATFADPASRRNEVVAEAEMNVDYAGSPIVTGDLGGRPGPGERLPGGTTVRPWRAVACTLRQLTFRAGHTVLVLGDDPADLLRRLQEAVSGSPLFEAVVALGTREATPRGSGASSPPPPIVSASGAPRCSPCARTASSACGRRASTWRLSSATAPSSSAGLHERSRRLGGLQQVGASPGPVVDSVRAPSRYRSARSSVGAHARVIGTEIT
jgi:2-polyprenyl-6-methoxyphenol hydroxylase-like FAD-dependent oxidoreductase